MERNILIAFFLNLVFSVFEFFGGIFTGSVAIISDAVHDMADAAGIGLSYLFEKKSKKQPDDQYTYGYSRYSVLGGVITTLILLFGSALVIWNAVGKIIDPTEINYNGMILLAAIGVVVNFCAALFTRGGDSLNQKAVNLHMLEDVLGWIVVLVGAIVMYFTDFTRIDPILSVGVALFILVNAVRNLRDGVNLLLEKTPRGINIAQIKERIAALHGVIDVHHIHIWSMDGQHNYATMHIVTNSDATQIKENIREELKLQGISHTTLEIEAEAEPCYQKDCRVEFHGNSCRHHHHH